MREENSEFVGLVLAILRDQMEFLVGGLDPAVLTKPGDFPWRVLQKVW